MVQVIGRSKETEGSRNWNSTQGSYGSWKSWKVLESYFGIFQDWEVLEDDYKSWKFLEICKLCFDHMIFTDSIARGTACKAYSKNKVIVDVATG